MSSMENPTNISSTLSSPPPRRWEKDDEPPLKRKREENLPLKSSASKKKRIVSLQVDDLVGENGFRYVYQNFPQLLKKKSNRNEVQ